MSAAAHALGRLTSRLARRVGRRGLVLLLFSLAFAFLGLKAFTDPATDGGRFVFYTELPNYARAVLWGFPALVGVLTALLGRHGDAFGFAALSVPPVFVAVSYLWSSVGFLLGVTSYPFGWVSAVSWLLIASVLLVCAGWAEVPKSSRRRVETVLIEEPLEDDR